MNLRPLLLTLPFLAACLIVFHPLARAVEVVTLVEFTGNGVDQKGARPFAELLDDGAGNFWGSTLSGGAADLGTIFKVNMISGTHSTVLEFSGTGPNNKGSGPAAGLVSDGAGNFWGSTFAGGSTGFGTLFKISATSGVLSTLIEFTGTTGNHLGARPSAALVSDGAGNLWGSTQQGGTNNFGTLFKINQLSETLTTVLQFTGTTGSSKGALPEAELFRDGAGDFWGSTIQGGSNNKGTVFKFDTGTETLTTKVEFTGTSGAFKGATPYAALVSDGAGSLWGSTVHGGTVNGSTGNGGTLFKINTANNDFTTLVQFSGVQGTSPYSALTNDGAGNFWGVLSAGGTTGEGTIFTINIASAAFTELMTFSGNGSTNKGANPQAKLVSDGAGNFWGSTQRGGQDNSGTLFKVPAVIPVQDYQPDISLGLQPAPTLGDGIYNTTAEGQTLAAKIAVGRKKIIYVEVQNDGVNADSFFITAVKGNKNFKVRYLNALTDVTEAVVSGTFSTGTLNPGEVFPLTVKIKAATPVAGKKRTLLINALSAGDSAQQDTVIIKAKSIAP